MALGFRQRLAALAVPKARRKELLHSRSADRFRPVVAGLRDSGNALHGWTQAPAQAACTVSWIGAGMDHLGNLLSGLTGLLHYLQVQEPERRRCQAASSWTQRLLRDLTLLVDAHGSFCEVLVSLKQLLAEAQTSLRHRDAARLAAALRTRHRSDRGLTLASTLRALSHHRSSSSTGATSHSGEAALAEAVAAATCAAAAGSAAIFAGLASISSSSALRALTSLTAASPAEAMERLQSLEECVLAAENGCEQVHRALVNTTESLLNVLTPWRLAK
uniref:Uncharacterized protein n=1 Tax=Avena sativa TaxID=4498 RepID=A0ACD5WEI7_AVESA